MFVQFKVGNYRSFKKPVVFSMVASKVTAEEEKAHKNNVFCIDEKLTLLKSAPIYGANASGKSNLAFAIEFMKRLVLNSCKEGQAAEEIDVEPFRLSAESITEPSLFEIVFILDGTTFRYGFKVNAQQVVSEWLFHTHKARESRLFERNSDFFSLSRKFKEGKLIPDKTRNNALFLSVVAQFNGEIGTKILRWFRETLNVIPGSHNRLCRNYTVKRFNNKQHRNDVLLFLKKLDLGIEDLQVETRGLQLPAESLSKGTGEACNSLLRRSGEQTEVKTFHRKHNVDGQQIPFEAFDLDRHESEGTKKLFALASHLLDALRIGTVLFVDELDVSLHPLITGAIINLFNSNDANPCNAQIIFTTHDTNLLSSNIFRRDQIWFAQKNKQGATDLYSLVEYKVQNNNTSFQSDYIHGRYGAIPLIDLQFTSFNPPESANVRSH